MLIFLGLIIISVGGVPEREPKVETTLGSIFIFCRPFVAISLHFQAEERSAIFLAKEEAEERHFLLQK